MKATCVVAALLPVLAACRSSAEPQAPLPLLEASSPAEIVLAVGQELRVDSLLRLAFVGVPADSRCPRMVMCFWAGDAAVEIAYAVGTGPFYPDTLHTALDPQAAQFAGYSIALLAVAPYPDRPGSIPADEYAARFRIERSPL